MTPQPKFQNTFILTSKLQRFLLKQPLKTQKKLKELETKYYNAVYICVS